MPLVECCCCPPKSNVLVLGETRVSSKMLFYPIVHNTSKATIIRVVAFQ